MIRGLVAMTVLCALGADAMAAPRLAKVFGDGMVLQREMPIRLWGTAEEGERVSVEFLGRQHAVLADAAGRFEAVLPPAPAGGPYTLVLHGNTDLTLRDVWVGEVWLASGQSNMEWSLAQSQDAMREVSDAQRMDGAIRHLKVPHQATLRPREDIPAATWQRAGPATADSVSAVGHFFARHLHRALGVPIGIVNASWGGTHAETWTPPAAAEADPDLGPIVRALPADEAAFAAQWVVDQQARLERWQGPPIAADALAASWSEPSFDDSAWKTLEVPQIWEEQGLEGFDGHVWFRREVTLDARDLEGPAELWLGMIDDCDETWVNGRRVGGQCGWDTPRRYTLPAGTLHEGRNLIAVRVTDLGGAGGFHGGADAVRLETPQRAIRLAGPWRARVEAPLAHRSLEANDAPTLAYNGMVHPLVGLSLRGVIWYQGESNVPRAARYAHTFAALIESWRAQWGRPDWPFLFVQLAGFDPQRNPGTLGSVWAELRDAQRQVQALPHTGMAVAADVGDADDIHPRNKQTVGERLARLALHRVHGHAIADSGPILQRWQREGRTFLLEFDPGDAGPLAVRGGGELTGFTLAGSDRRFVPARARIEGRNVLVWRDDLDDPVAVRYGWLDDPGPANLANRSGLPASPVRSDRWPLLSDGVRFGKDGTTR